MDILVLVKEVPDMNKVRFDRERGVVDRSSAPAEMNPFDESALQTAIDLKEACGGTVTVLTMGPAGAMRTLRDAYARGADDAVLLSDRAFGGSDTFATATALAAAIKNIGPDLIICGEKSVDGDTAQVGAEVAQLMGIPHCYYADKVELADAEYVRVTIAELCGRKQIRSMKLPALVGVTKNTAKLKLPTVNRKLESLDREFRIMTIADIPALKKEDVGFTGSPTKVVKIEVPPDEDRNSVVFRNDISGFLQAVADGMKLKGVI